MFFKINASEAVPFVNGFLGAPADGFVGQGMVLVHKGLFGRAQKLVGYLFDLGLHRFYIYPYRLLFANDSRNVITAVGNGEMKAIALENRLAAVGNADVLQGKIREQLQEKISAGKMLQAFMRVMYFGRDIDPRPEEGFILLFTNFPHSEAGSLIHLYGTY
jgi:hypothetical protein